MKLIRKIGVIALVVLLTFTSAFGASERKPIDTGRKANFTIENLCCRKVAYSVYKVADISAGSRLSWTPEVSALLAKYENPLPVEWENQEEWSRVAETLASYAMEDAALPEAERVLTPVSGTKSDRTLAFTGLDLGVYLAFAPDHFDGDKRHTMRPFVITLPGENPESGEWNYSVTVKPKYSESGGTTEGGTIRRSVTKVWEDSQNESGARPDSVLVQLLRDGRPYGDVVELSASNQWSASFGELSADYSWDVREVSVPGDYVMTVSENGTTFTVLNSLLEDILDEDPPLSDLPVLPGGTDVPGQNGNGGNGGELTDIFDEDTPLARLPQTGALWWPVIPLFCGGIFLYALGVKKSRKVDWEQR